jgi:NitT/TauT family transport system ATP-binding protein
MSFIQFENVRKRYGETIILDGINLSVERHELVAIVGPYGSGKTTLFKILSGLSKSYEGRVTINGASPQEELSNRKIGYCFQSPTLLPWRNVQDNLALPQEIINKKDTDRVEKLLEIGSLSAYATQSIDHLSGGMRQVLSILRALVLDPDILLLDEPFSAIDELSRERFQTILSNIHEETKKTTIIITHSLQEAVWLADKVVVLTSKPTTVKKVFKIPKNCRQDRYGREFNKKVADIKKCLSNA